MKINEPVNILFAGVGGQGVLKAAEIAGWAAIYEGYHVKKSEVHGMAQRGGSVESHLRFGRRVFSPLIPAGAVDYLVSFHRGERDRLGRLLKRDGIDLIEGLAEAERSLDDPRYVNTYLLGVLSTHLPIKQENWLKALQKALPDKYVAQNTEVFLKARAKVP